MEKTELPLSIAILARNEEKNLPRALNSLKGWGVEIVVVNAESADKTEEIAKQYTDKVYTRENVYQLNINKTVAFDHCTRDWIFYLDGDEELTIGNKKEIEKAIADPNFDGYWVPRKNIIFGHWMRWGGNYPDAGLRLFRRGKGHFPCQDVHEQLEVDGRVGELKAPFNHYTSESINQWMDRANFYTSFEAKLIIERHKNLWMYIFIRPVYRFLKSYIYQLGFLDGRYGFIYAVLGSYYFFLAGAKAITKRF